MPPSLNLYATQSQRLGLSPRLQAAVRLLQLSSLDYARELGAAVATNPFLELDDDAHASRDGGDDRSVHRLAAELPDDERLERVSQPAADVDFEGRIESAADAVASRSDDWSSPAEHPHHEASEADAGALAAAEVSLREQLMSQVNVMRMTDRERALVTAMVDSLDDDGWLRLSLEEVGPLAALYPAAEPSELVVALRLLQTCEPCGVGARSLAECLALQWRQLEMSPSDRALGQLVIDEHLGVLAHHDVATLAKRCQCAPSDAARVSQAIRRLDPRPGHAFGTGEPRYVTPDVIVRKVRGRWTAKLNNSIVPRLRINQRCATLFGRHGDGRHGELAGHLREARWTLRNLEQRFSTILDVSNAILQRQYQFLELGAFAMKPLALRDIAADCGVHESTVCRATNNKYMSTPSGVFELKFFFSRPIQLRGGGASSKTAIRGLIGELIAAEAPEAPLSDVEIAHILERQGLQVGRRTVTNYRQSLKVASADKRRRVGAA